MKSSASWAKNNKKPSYCSDSARCEKTAGSRWTCFGVRVPRALDYPTTLCLKKVSTFKLSETLSNLNRFSKFLHCWKAYEICYKTHMTVHYLGKLKIQISGRLSTVPVTQLFNSLLTSSFVQLISGNSSVNLFAVYLFKYKLLFLSKSRPRRWIPCWLLTFTAVTSAVTNFRCHRLIAKVNNSKNSDMDFLQSVWGNSLFQTPKISKYVDE